MIMVTIEYFTKDLNMKSVDLNLGQYGWIVYQNPNLIILGQP
jgi:hypothetical protein